MTSHDDVAPTALRIVREIPATPDRVWRAWTDPDELIAWYWPASFKTTAEVDLRIGGRFRIASVVAGMAVSGEFVAVEPPHRLVQTWQWDGEDTVTLVTTQFRPSPDDDTRTEVIVLHERFPDPGERDNHALGWEHCLDRLVGYAF